MSAFNNRGKGTEVFKSAISTGSKEDIIYFFAEKSLARIKAHILKRFLERSPSTRFYTVKKWHTLRNAYSHSRVGAVCNSGLYVFRTEMIFLVEDGIIIATQCFPVSHRLVPVFSFGSKFFSAYIFNSNLVGCHYASPCSHLYRKVA